MKKALVQFWSITVAAVFMLVTMTNCNKDIEALASTTNTARKCSSKDKIDELLRQNPEVRESRNRIEENTRQFVQTYDDNAKSRAVVTIPVVVHIVWNTAAQNISDAQIQSQLVVLNKDFRKLNADANSTPSVFKPLAADAEVNFVLAKQDPSGKATTGIVRKQTTATKYTGSNNNMMSAATGGSDIWDSKRYLNIYVCNLTGYLGYAYPPGSPANIDAIAIAYTAFGTTGTATAPYQFGRTATHEVGHWLNLEHIWGDDEQESDVCSGSDGVSDTPNSGVSNEGCPSFPHITCGNTPNGDMFMNYMDYADDNCQNLFTQGQKVRMQALFGANGARRSLLTSNGGTAPSGGTSTTCTDNYESNNTAATAKTIPVNTAITAKIGTATDIDWFSFSNSST